MNESRITRNVIHIVSAHQKLPTEEVKRQLETNIYADRTAWAKFINIALLSLGIAFTLIGIIFFFAYNWHLLNKFVKLGIVEVLTIISICVALFYRNKPFFSNVVLTASSVLVGAMFSVFGQIYQTGADAYDFFLGWTVFVAIWAMVSNFAVLWLLLITLINTTFFFYIEQVGASWQGGDFCFVLTAFNATVLIAVKAIANKSTLIIVPNWFDRIVSLAVAFFITIGATNYIYGRNSGLLWFFFLLAIAIYSFAILWSYKKLSLYYLCIIPLSVIIIVCSLIFKVSDRGDLTGTFFFSGLFVIISVTLLIRWLINLHKLWNGKSEQH